MGTGILLLVAAVSTTAVRLLGPHALTVVQSPAPARLEDAVTAAAVVLATVLAAWYLATALLGLLARLLRVGQRVLERRGAARTRAVRAVRASAATLEGMVRNLGAPALRRGLAIGVGLGLAVGTGPALAAPASEVPLDLRPGASSDEPTPDAGTATTPPTSGSAQTDASPLGGSTGRPARAPSEEPSGAQHPQTPASPGGATGPPAATSSSSPSRPAAATPPPATTAPPPERTPPWAASTVTPDAPPAAQAPAPPAPLSSAGAHRPVHGSSAPAGDSRPDSHPHDHQGDANPAADHPGAEQPEPTTGHTVAGGESLWRIAADHLGPGASDAAVAREWPRWYAANAATIGPDPNLIRPGQELLAPPKEAGP